MLQPCCPSGEEGLTKAQRHEAHVHTVARLVDVTAAGTLVLSADQPSPEPRPDSTSFADTPPHAAGRASRGGRPSASIASYARGSPSFADKLQVSGRETALPRPGRTSG